MRLHMSSHGPTQYLYTERTLTIFSIQKIKTETVNYVVLHQFVFTVTKVKVMLEKNLTNKYKKSKRKTKRTLPRTTRRQVSLLFSPFTLLQENAEVLSKFEKKYMYIHNSSIIAYKFVKGQTFRS